MTDESKPTTDGDRTRPCPVCGSPMVVQRHADVSVDIFAEHGVWLDAG